MDRRFIKGLGRAVGGSIVFSLPMLMTMEMWELGAYMSRGRLALLLVLLVPLLVGLSHVSGFEETFDWKEDVVDAFVACAVAAATAAVCLLLFSVMDGGTPLREWHGHIVLQMVPGSVGALLAQAQFGGDEAEEAERERTSSYGGEIFLVLVGALFLSLNIAPTEEVVLIGYRITPWYALMLVAISMLVIHAFVYAVDFHGAPEVEEDVPWWRPVVFFTVPAYVIAFSVSLFVLWSFGRFDGAGIGAVVLPSVVLAFPASVGGAAARLLV